ncbi:MAG: Hsp20/alpha crystallin family protein [Polyangiaceae bacterium]|nr:Hsp20/alpha crystallin family protein [Polyangiaceae bacterium]
MAQPIEPDLVKPIRDDAAVKRSRMQTQAFKPPLDIIADDDAVIIELVVPGVDRSDIRVERVEGGLMVQGVRPEAGAGDQRAYHYTETPRGPFARAIPLPFALEGDPPVELDRGVLRIRLNVPKREVEEKSAANRNRGEKRK